jgi:hypothetical protein
LNLDNFFGYNLIAFNSAQLFDYIYSCYFVVLHDTQTMDSPLELEKFIADTDKWVDTVLTSLGWTRDHILQVKSV